MSTDGKGVGAAIFSGLSRLTRAVVEKTEVAAKTERVLSSVKAKANDVIEDLRRRSSKTDMVITAIKEHSAVVAQSVRDHVFKGDIDFSFITGRVGVAATPVDNLEFAVNRRNRADQVAKFLDHHYGERYMMFNLVPDIKPINAAEKFSFRVKDLPVTVGGSLSLPALYSTCEALYDFLRENLKISAVLVCPDGSSYCALVVSCLLLYAKVVSTPAEAVAVFKLKRGDSKGFLSPLHARYLNYFGRIVSNRPESFPHRGRFVIEQLRMRPIPTFSFMRDGCRPFVEIYEGGNLVFTSIADHDNLEFYCIDYHRKAILPLNVSVQGDVTIVAYHARRTLQTSAASGMRTIKRMLDEPEQERLALGNCPNYGNQQQRQISQKNNTDVMGMQMFKFQFNAGFLDVNCDKIKLARIDVDSDADWTKMPGDFTALVKLRPDTAVDPRPTVPLVEYPWETQRSQLPRDPTVLFATPRELDSLAEKMSCMLGSPTLRSGVAEERAPLVEGNPRESCPGAGPRPTVLLPRSQRNSDLDDSDGETYGLRRVWTNPTAGTFSSSSTPLRTPMPPSSPQLSPVQSRVNAFQKSAMQAPPLMSLDDDPPSQKPPAAAGHGDAADNDLQFLLELESITKQPVDDEVRVVNGCSALDDMLDFTDFSQLKEPVPQNPFGEGGYGPLDNNLSVELSAADDGLLLEPGDVSVQQDQKPAIDNPSQPGPTSLTPSDVLQRIDGWKRGNEANVRVLLATLHTVLPPSANWYPVSMYSVYSDLDLRRIYRMACLTLQPDKLKDPKYFELYAAVYAVLQTAWNHHINGGEPMSPIAC